MIPRIAGGGRFEGLKRFSATAAGMLASAPLCRQPVPTVLLDPESRVYLRRPFSCILRLLTLYCVLERGRVLVYLGRCNATSFHSEAQA